MTNACRSLITMLFSEYRLSRVELHVDPGNGTRRVVAERFGFQVEGYVRNAEWLQDHYVEHLTSSPRLKPAGFTVSTGGDSQYRY